MRSEADARRRSTRHHVESFAAAHRAQDVSSPFTSGPSNNLSPSQFKGMYVRNPIRNQYRHFMQVKSPYHKTS